MLWHKIFLFVELREAKGKLSRLFKGMVLFTELSEAATRCPCFLMTAPEWGIRQDAATRARIWGSCCREILTASASSSLVTFQLAESVVVDVEFRRDSASHSGGGDKAQPPVSVHLGPATCSFMPCSCDHTAHCSAQALEQHSWNPLPLGGESIQSRRVSLLANSLTQADTFPKWTLKPFVVYRSSNETDSNGNLALGQGCWNRSSSRRFMLAPCHSSPTGTHGQHRKSHLLHLKWSLTQNELGLSKDLFESFSS